MLVIDIGQVDFPISLVFHPIPPPGIVGNLEQIQIPNEGGRGSGGVLHTLYPGKSPRIGGWVGGERELTWQISSRKLELQGRLCLHSHYVLDDTKIRVYSPGVQFILREPDKFLNHACVSGELSPYIFCLDLGDAV